MKTVTKLSLILIVVCIVATVIYGLVFVAPPQSTVPVVVQPEPVVCTMEAKQCPDGSYVGRSGPQCEFAACPSPNTTPPSIRPYDSGVHGTVMLGPTCPVMRNPPDPSCADKPYATLVVVFRSSDPAHAYAMTRSDSLGRFSFSLPPGDYTLGAGESNLPRCNHPEVSVGPTGYATTTVSCDTGIR